VIYKKQLSSLGHIDELSDDEEIGECCVPQPHIINSIEASRPGSLEISALSTCSIAVGQSRKECFIFIAGGCGEMW
jgi:hypothetical protein